VCRSCRATDAEIRWCPSLHCDLGLEFEQAVAAVARGLRTGEAAAPGHRFRQVLTVLRSLGTDEAARVLSLAARSQDEHVVGVDLAGDETQFPAKLFAEEFQKLRKSNPTLGITVHAGEGDGEQAIQNVRDAVELLGADRIGHGCAASRDPSVMALLKARDILVEVCPTSNVHTGTVSSIAEHPVRLFFDAGIRIAVCADNTLLSRTTAKQELIKLMDNKVFSAEEIHRIAKNALTAGFA